MKIFLGNNLNDLILVINFYKKELLIVLEKLLKIFIQINYQVKLDKLCYKNVLMKDK